MSEAPERIWLTGFVKDEYGARLGRGTISDLDHGQNPDYPEYVRADRIEELEAKLSESEALLAKAVDALEVIRMYYGCNSAKNYAFNILAELKGEK